MKFDIKNKLNKLGFKAKKHSPEILIAAGVIGTVTSAVLACRATMKVNDILNESKVNLDTIHMVREDSELSEKYSEADAKKDTSIVYIQTGVKIIKLYAVPVLLGALSLTAIIASNNILRKRNVAIGAAYVAVDKSFKKYRKNVVEKFGTDIDKELRYGIKAEKIEETKIDKNGNEKKVKKTVTTIDQDLYSEYAKIFDATNPNWTNDPEYNMMFLKAQQNYANDLLRVKKYLFLNDIYEALGFPRTKAGQIIGWVYDEDEVLGDNFVDFGIFDLSKQSSKNFVNCNENDIILDFNVHGNVWDMM